MICHLNFLERFYIFNIKIELNSVFIYKLTSAYTVVVDIRIYKKKTRPQVQWTFWKWTKFANIPENKRKDKIKNIEIECQLVILSESIFVAKITISLSKFRYYFCSTYFICHQLIKLFNWMSPSKLPKIKCYDQRKKKIQ